MSTVEKIYCYLNEQLSFIYRNKSNVRGLQYASLAAMTYGWAKVLFVRLTTRTRTNVDSHMSHQTPKSKSGVTSLAKSMNIL